ncbi:hypothetical protein AMAG_12257 [Allomyces macrogynus ATCC 38327]|uniref:Adhesin domain-containing protein n=1 Tax=Allomyces macrogynus (strain ATCC 38327) TaxID=578462 RepID=A0A0L0SXH5_ALLM3|nr:hypothetical protein AMAG_12257 [Allomyces macrogynus ATCC 38327]|eukprot:KNE67191.1 hypothetical protein AMAG_12257 [Allomyces macrogynus ATCC 38327]
MPDHKSAPASYASLDDLIPTRDDAEPSSGSVETMRSAISLHEPATWLESMAARVILLFVPPVPASRTFLLAPTVFRETDALLPRPVSSQHDGKGMVTKMAQSVWMAGRRVMVALVLVVVLLLLIAVATSSLLAPVSDPSIDGPTRLCVPDALRWSRNSVAMPIHASTRTVHVVWSDQEDARPQQALPVHEIHVFQAEPGSTNLVTVQAQCDSGSDPVFLEATTTTGPDATIAINLGRVAILSTTNITCPAIQCPHAVWSIYLPDSIKLRAHLDDQTARGAQLTMHETLTLGELDLRTRAGSITAVASLVAPRVSLATDGAGSIIISHVAATVRDIALRSATGAVRVAEMTRALVHAAEPGRFTIDSITGDVAVHVRTIGSGDDIVSACAIDTPTVAVTVHAAQVTAVAMSDRPAARMLVNAANSGGEAVRVCADSVVVSSLPQVDDEWTIASAHGMVELWVS